MAWWNPGDRCTGCGSYLKHDEYDCPNPTCNMLGELIAEEYRRSAIQFETSHRISQECIEQSDREQQKIADGERRNSWIAGILLLLGLAALYYILTN